KHTEILFVITPAVIIPENGSLMMSVKLPTHPKEHGSVYRIGILIDQAILVQLPTETTLSVTMTVYGAPQLSVGTLFAFLTSNPRPPNFTNNPVRAFLPVTVECSSANLTQWLTQ